MMLNEGKFTSKGEAIYMRLVAGLLTIVGLFLAICFLVLIFENPVVAFIIIGFIGTCYGCGCLWAWRERKNNNTNG